MSQELGSNSYSNAKKLNEEELKELWNNFILDKSNKELRNRLIIQYLYLTRYVVGRVKVALPPSFSIEDISSFGVEGLIDAVERYSPQLGASFETYALMRIRGHILDRVRSQDFLPRSARKKIKDVKTAQENLKQKLGRQPTIKELAQELGWEKERVENTLLEDTTITSIYEKKSSNEDSIEIIDTIQDTNKLNPQEEMEEKDSKWQLERALSRLPERERTIVVLYYHENMTLKEIGDVVNISESRVCQLHAQAIMKLKNILSANRSDRLRKKRIV